MDRRTLRIKELERKLAIARDFILRCGISSLRAFDENKQMSRSYWGEESIRLYAETKPNNG